MNVAEAEAAVEEPAGAPGAISSFFTSMFSDNDEDKAAAEKGAADNAAAEKAAADKAARDKAAAEATAAAEARAVADKLAAEKAAADGAADAQAQAESESEAEAEAAKAAAEAEDREQAERAEREKIERERAEKEAVDKAMASKSASERAQLAKLAAETRTTLLALRPVIGLTIPSETDEEETRLYNEARKKRRGSVSATEALKQRASLHEHEKGIPIREVKAGSAGDRAGLQKGTFVLAFEGVTIKNYADFTKALGSRTPGDPVRLKLFDPAPNGAGVHEVKVVLGAAGKTPEEVAALRNRLVPIGILPEHVIDRSIEMNDEARKLLGAEKKKKSFFGFGS